MSWDSLAEPFQFAFFRNGMIVAVLAGALCGLVGVFVVLRGMSYIGHGLSHAIFGGAAVAAALSLNFYVGAGIWGLGSALAIGGVTRRRLIGSDAAIGVITTASFALGVALLGLSASAKRGTNALLFGSILGVSPTDVWVIAAVALLASSGVFLRYRRLLFSTFDPDVADVSGVSTARADALLMAVLALVLLSTMQVLGVTLIAATLVIPPVVARMLTNSFSRMLWLSTGIGAAAGFVGMLVSYHLDISSGAAIVLVGAALFVAVFVATGPRGLRRTAAIAPH